jgi:hypothetical protein
MVVVNVDEPVNRNARNRAHLACIGRQSRTAPT